MLDAIKDLEEKWAMLEVPQTFHVDDHKTDNHLMSAVL